MKPKIVRLEIIDTDVEFDKPLLSVYHLLNPDKNKLEELKHMVEHRSDAMYDENASDEEIRQAEEFCDAIWDNIDGFINENFVTLDIEETYEIEY